MLTRNHLSSFPKNLFQSMKGLRLLELNRNRFVKVQGLSFLGLENLKVLRMRRNKVRKGTARERQNFFFIFGSCYISRSNT